MRIESAPGQGTTTYIYLPRTEAEVEVSEAIGPADHAPRGQGETILHVEDESAVREVVAELLRDANYTPLSAADGAEALRLHELHGGQIAAVISDVIMPGMSGPELCRQLRARDPGVPIMLMSGYPMSHHTADLQGLAVDSWVMKPIRLNDLCQQLAGLLAARRGDNEARCLRAGAPGRREARP